MQGQGPVEPITELYIDLAMYDEMNSSLKISHSLRA